jgi:LemA protein
VKRPIVIGCLALAVLAVLVVGIGGCSSYNRLVGLSESVDQSWSQVENVYQRRLDLVPNLVRTVEGQAAFEKTTLQEITNARASVGQIKLSPGQVPDQATLEKFEQAQAQLGGALSRLIAVAENYPQLRANEGFLALQAELAGTENRIAVERRRFNEAAQAFNTAVKRFPTILFARLLGFPPRPYFQSAAGAEQPPKVEFKFDKPGAPQ